MSQIEFPIATELLEKIDDPLLMLAEQDVVAADPELSQVEVLDRALAMAIAHLHYTVNQQTFAYLRWKVVVARETARRAIEGSRLKRAERVAAQDRLSRSYYAADGSVWSVTELAGNVPGRPGQRCLVFASADAVRRVWNFPANWRDLTDADLESLSWER
jgi:hypothetical protein